MNRQRGSRDRDGRDARRDNKVDAAREYIVSALRAGNEPLSLAALARKLGIGSAARRRLKSELGVLVAEGTVTRVGGERFAIRSEVPEITVLDVIETGPDDADLFATLPPREGGRAAGLFLLDTGRFAPAPGDRVLARLSARGRERRAHVLRVMEPPPAAIVGVFVAGPRGGTIKPVDRRLKQTPVVRAPDRGGAVDGELVRAELLSDQSLVPRARNVERLGPARGPRAVSLIAVHQHGIPVAFPRAALDEARRAPQPQLGRRADLREMPLITIDGADARDFDDAVFAAADGAGWRIVVAISDVAHYVRPDSALDAAARERGNSVYFPDRVIPMLPPELSDDLCSLKPGAERHCFAAHLWVDGRGRLLRHRFERALMRSAARLTYEQVQAARDGSVDHVTEPIAETVIAPLYAAFGALLAARRHRQALELDLPERKIHLCADGRVERIAPVPRLDSHRVIEEFMVLANVAAAEALEARRQPCMYRIHETPDLAKLEALRPVLSELGLGLPPTGIRARDFNRVLAQVRGAAHERLINELVLRAQSQASYSPQNRGHFGLALTRYAHFTSPIRRYADLLVHRALIGESDADGLGRGAVRDWDEVGAHVSHTERRAMAAERDAFDRYVAEFLTGRVGAEFEATIRGVTRHGLFAALDELGAEGFIPMTRLPQDYYRHDPGRHMLLGRRGGARFRLGDRATVRISEADGLSRSLIFDLVGHRAATPPTVSRATRLPTGKQKPMRRRRR